MPGEVQVEVVPGPVNPSNSLPAVVALGRGTIGELGDHVSAKGIGRWLDHELIEVSPLGKERERAELCLDLVLQSQIGPTSILTAAVLECGSNETYAAGSRIKKDDLARQQNTALEAA